ncbi:hypothetical protein MSAN_00533200 [Mycena sanguinolenta]|uniref:Uncharacterized protein n=1 Tax=Mycena sanguinolenta TaxID=230812 RepID=A0A8H7DI86_9AGAR|nr:hypothetical protein MSAN_00533200 [Mycena sanguinolenta]
MLAMDNLSSNAHTLVAYAQSSSWFFFDYAIYTFDDGIAATTSVGTPVVSQPPTTSSKSDDTSTGSSASASSIRSSSMSQGVIPNSTVEVITTNTVQATTTTTAPANGTTGQDNSNQMTGPSPASSKSHSSTAIVVGSVCGALAILLACALIWCRRRQRHRNVPRLQADAFVVDPTPHATEGSCSIVEAREAPRLQSSTQWRESRAETFLTTLPPYTPRGLPQTPQDSTTSLLAANKQRMDPR